MTLRTDVSATVETCPLIFVAELAELPDTRRMTKPPQRTQRKQQNWNPVSNRDTGIETSETSKNLVSSNHNPWFYVPAPMKVRGQEENGENNPVSATSCARLIQGLSRRKGGQQVSRNFSRTSLLCCQDGGPPF